MKMKQKFSKEEQDKLVKQIQEAGNRVMLKLKKRMLDLSKDKKLKEQTLKEINDTFKHNNSSQRKSRTKEVK